MGFGFDDVRRVERLLARSSGIQFSIYTQFIYGMYLSETGYCSRSCDQCMSIFLISCFAGFST